ncbi:MAG: bifunctional YncE family protein/alkaline phosphatase family protein [Bacteroidales bacterium]|nr:bifunctional YncE family protein/alkaline phosphatase family protein [Bacteroidales bacterium]
MPYNKILKPAGTMIFFGDSALENHALDVALSPDRKTLAVEGRYCVVFINTADNKILYRLNIYKYDKKNSVSTYSGITWFENMGKQYVLWGTRNKLMQAEWNGSTAEIVKDFEFMPKKGVAASLPNEMVIQREKGKPMVYLVLDGNDEVVKLELNSGKVIWQKPVGLAPYGIVMARGRLYVSDWSGTVPSANDKNVAGIPWENAHVDRFGTVSSGAVSVLDPRTGRTIKEIKVGLHPNKVISGPEQRFVYVANGNDDNISVINTKTNHISETISVRLNQDKNPYYGDSPNGLALSPNGKTLYVANGMDNALAVISLGKKASLSGKQLNSSQQGFIPTAAYPGAVKLYKDSLLYVADIEGIGARLTSPNTKNKAYQTFIKVDGKRTPTAGAFNTHRMLAVVSVIPVPGKKELENYTQIVKKSNDQARLALLNLLPRDGVAPVPVPQRIGEPSVFKHVIYIIRENRTYDQIFGDVKKGNGDAALCTFGENVTPNAHRIVQNFVLLDNYRASGKCSAEGHLWTDASTVTDYIEKNVRAWFRSYTHVLYDAMAYPKTGFIWDDALDHGKTVRIYGETAIPEWKDGKKWTGIYQDYLAGKPFIFTNKTTIARVRGILAPDYPGYDSHNITDQIRATAFIKELNSFESEKGDQYPDLTIIALPDDHTAGTAPGFPTPRAMVADNDYALGRIIDALSHSKFWKNTVVFITEDDSQNGWDHVSAYRTVGMVISPYTRDGKVVSTNYNQTSMIRTIEQILGIPPMNIEDATAKPMFDVFSDKPDFTPYTAVKNNIPLNEMNPQLSALNGQQKSYAEASLAMAQKGIDAGNDDLLNRIIWSSVEKNKAYPAKYAGKEGDHDDD